MATGSPFFTVVVPVYNHQRYVGAALDSLLAQTDRDWEAVVVNDGSTDATPEVIEDYASRDPRIRTIHQSNGGQPVALNSGIRAARGKWICWLSSDDLFDPGKLAVHRRWIERNPGCSYFFSRFRTLDDATGRVSRSDQGAIPDREWQVLDLLSHNYINGITLCIRRQAFDEGGLFDESNRYGQDYDLHLRMLTRYEALHIPEETCISRTHAGQFTLTENRSMFYDCASAAVGFLARTPFQAMFPLMDLHDPACATAAVDRALDVAISADAYVNQLGPHPMLFGRIMEWAWSQSGAHGRQLRKLFVWRTLAAARGVKDPRRAAFWRAAGVLAATAPSRSEPHSCTAVELADAALSELTARGDPEAEAVRRFIEKRQGREPKRCPTPAGTDRADIVIDAGDGEHEASELGSRGWRVTRIDRQSDGLGLREWGWNMGVKSAGRSVASALCVVPRWPAAVGCGRSVWALNAASESRAFVATKGLPFDGGVPTCAPSGGNGVCAAAVRAVLRAGWRVRNRLGTR